MNLTKDQETEYIIKYDPLIKKNAYRFSRNRIGDYEDLYQEARLTLLLLLRECENEEEVLLQLTSMVKACAWRWLAANRLLFSVPKDVYQSVYKKALPQASEDDIDKVACDLSCIIDADTTIDYQTFMSNVRSRNAKMIDDKLSGYSMSEIASRRNAKSEHAVTVSITKLRSMFNHYVTDVA